jgi:hypothetical protein
MDQNLDKPIEEMIDEGNQLIIDKKGDYAIRKGRTGHHG